MSNHAARLERWTDLGQRRGLTREEARRAAEAALRAYERIQKSPGQFTLVTGGEIIEDTDGKPWGVAPIKKYTDGFQPRPQS